MVETRTSSHEGQVTRMSSVATSSERPFTRALVHAYAAPPAVRTKPSTSASLFCVPAMISPLVTPILPINSSTTLPRNMVKIRPNTR